MAIKVDIRDDELFTAEELKRLKELFEDTHGGDYEKAMEKIVHAALCEYKEMLLGSGVPPRADEIRRLRLFHLIKNYFGLRLPSEEEVTLMFQLTPLRSHNLIRSLIVSFRHELDAEVRVTLAETMCRCRLHPASNKYRVIIQSSNVLEELNRIVRRVAPRFDQIAKVRYMASMYSMPKDSRRALLRYLLHEALEEASHDDRNGVYVVAGCLPCLVEELREILSDKTVKMSNGLKSVDEKARTCEIASDVCERVQAFLSEYWTKCRLGE